MFCGNLQIIPNIESWRKWSNADPGKLPARNKITARGVRGKSRWRFETTSLWWLSTKSSSCLESTRVAIPESSTGTPYSWWMRRLAAGLPRWPRAIPEWSTAASAFLWAVILVKIGTLFPAVDRTIPTCSAQSSNSTFVSFMVMGFVFFAYLTLSSHSLG